jgi:hypothetical protein
MTQEQIDTILKKHQLWLDGKEGGECANFQDANFQGADLDFSCFPLSCGGTKFKADIKLAYQLLAHLCTLEIDDSDWQELKDKIMPYAKKSHRATELGL